MKIYLAGSIGGLSYKDATEWRQYVKYHLTGITDVSWSR